MIDQGNKKSPRIKYMGYSVEGKRILTPFYPVISGFTIGSTLAAGTTRSENYSKQDDR